MVVEQLGGVRRSFHESLQEVYPKVSQGKVVVALYPEDGTGGQAWKLIFAPFLGHDVYISS